MKSIIVADADRKSISTRAGGLAVKVATGAAMIVGIVLASTGTAAADEQVPPSSAIAAPSSSAQAASGDSGRQYWASDGCHYYLEAGQWWSDQCSIVGPGPTADVYQNEGNGQLGQLLLSYDGSDPAWNEMTFGPATGTPRSMRVSTSDQNRVQTLGTTNTGQPIWVDVPRSGSTTVGGGRW